MSFALAALCVLAVSFLADRSNPSRRTNPRRDSRGGLRIDGALQTSARVLSRQVRFGRPAISGFRPRLATRQHVEGRSHDGLRPGRTVRGGHRVPDDLRAFLAAIVTDEVIAHDRATGDNFDEGVHCALGDEGYLADYQAGSRRRIRRAAACGSSRRRSDARARRGSTRARRAWSPKRCNSSRRPSWSPT